MITPFTEVIFIDEVDGSALDIADWKILTQGGHTAHDVKYQTAKAFMNKCPMLVTAQHKLEFGVTHQPAIDRCLCTYTFKSLPGRQQLGWERTPWNASFGLLRKHAAKEDSENGKLRTDSDEESIAEDEEGEFKETGGDKSNLTFQSSSGRNHCRHEWRGNVGWFHPRGWYTKWRAYCVESHWRGCIQVAKILATEAHVLRRRAKTIPAT